MMQIRDDVEAQTALPAAPSANGADAPAHAHPIIETSGLTKRFSKHRNYRALLRLGRSEDLVAVDAVTLQIRAGEVFGLLGPNGAGKTTLVKMLCTLVLPSAGRALIDGKDVVAEAAAVRQRVGLIDCQERSFFWRLTGRQNLQFFAAVHNLHGAAANRRIADLLDIVGLGDHADRQFMHYSSGMRQKLAIARGLLAMPPIVFMDEPTRSLDPLVASDLRAFIRETLVQQLKRTVVLVTHRLEEAEELCRRVAIMHRGQIVACGPVTDIKQRMAARQQYHLRVCHLAPAVIADLRAIPGVVQVHATAVDAQRLALDLLLADERVALPAILQAIVACGGAIEHCHAASPSLEQAFVDLVRGGSNGV